MGIKSDKTVYECSNFMVLKHQGCNNDRNLEYINNTTLTSTYDNYNNNTHVNNNSRIVKQDIDTFSMNQDHPEIPIHLARIIQVILL